MDRIEYYNISPWIKWKNKISFLGYLRYSRYLRYRKNEKNKIFLHR